MCAKIQLGADCDHAKGIHEGTKTACEVITDQNKQLQHWVEYNLELYSTQKIITDAALDAMPGLPVIEELDTMLTLEELSKAIDCHDCGKASGKDSIPPEVLKHGKKAILQTLHQLLCLF